MPLRFVRLPMPGFMLDKHNCIAIHYVLAFSGPIGPVAIDAMHLEHRRRPSLEHGAESAANMGVLPIINGSPKLVD